MPSETRLNRTGRWLALALLAAAMGAWAWASLHYSEVPLVWFYSAASIAVAGWVLGFCCCDDRHRRFLLWGAVVLHLVGVAGQPVLEDDHYRYLWDGYQFATTGTPYGKAPEDYFSDTTLPPAFQQLIGDINYPQLPTLYGATNQYLFALGYWIKPASITPLQFLLSAFNLLLIWQLLKRAPVRYVLLYAWSPLVLKEIAFTAHTDGLGAGLLLLAAFSLCGRNRTGGAVLLALACGVKVFAWLLIPFLLVRQRPRIWLAFVLSCALLYLPFLLQPGSELTSLQVFAESWQFNPALFWLSLYVLPPDTARWLLGGCLGLFLLIYWWRYVQQLGPLDRTVLPFSWLWMPSDAASRPLPRAELVFGALLLVSPVINAWYLLWLLPFAVLQRLLWPWAASVALLLSYLTWLNLEDYSKDPFTLPASVTLVEFSLIAAAVLLDGLRYLRRRAQGSATGA